MTATPGIFLTHPGFVSFYPPWTLLVVQRLPWALMIGVSLAAYSLATIQRAVHPLSAVAAHLCLPLLWTVFLGQLEGLVVLGMLGLPWLVPLVLLKPQISFFGLGARRSYVLAFLIFLALSLLIWGNWPPGVIPGILPAAGSGA